MRVSIELDDPSLVDPVQKHLPPGAKTIEPHELDRTFRVAWVEAADSPVNRDGHHFFIDGHFSGIFPDAELAVEMIESRVQHYIAEFARPHLFLHAGVVGWGGRAIVLPGKSHSGKSTLVKALVDAGANYLSDEYAVLDPSGRVHPFPRALSMRDGPLGPAGRVDLSHRVPESGQADRALDIGLVALLKHRKSARWDVEPLSPPQAIMAMCEHTVAIQRRPNDTLAILGRVAQGAVTVRGMRGEVEDAVEHLLRMASGI